MSTHPSLRAFALACLFSRASLAIPPLSAAADALPPPFARALFGASRPPSVALAPDGTLRFNPLDAPAQSLCAGVSLVVSLDRTRALTFTDAAFRRTSLTGRGVVVGVVDTGIDLLHSDFRAADGASRAAWVIDYTQAPVGLHPALEARFGLAFDGASRGAVWSAEDLAPSLRAARPPTDDDDGHGTFVASIAAGNGLSTAPARFVGVAPESALVVVRASSAQRPSIADAVVLAGASFVFDRAAFMGMPAVVNLSVGSHDGAHDGDSAFERALTSLTDGPGRALVASAGNDQQRPLHARASLSPGAVTPVSLWLPDAPADGPARLVGVSVSYRDGLSLAVRLPDGAVTPFVAPGDASAFRLSGALVSIANATDGASPHTGSRTADVLIASGADSRARRPSGAWTLLLRGAGRADAYLFRDDGEGAPRARILDHLSDATVTLPATATGVIAVGALSTRASFVALPSSVQIALFSSHGPGLDGALRPDLVAPGDMVFAARAHAARNDPSSMFSEPARVTPDGEHVGASGTSAAAPHVTGAVALLLQQDPTLTARELSAVLTASARPVTHAPRWNASEGCGALDVDAALSLAHALRASAPDAPIDLVASEATLAETSLAPGESTRVSVRLVTAAGLPARAAHRVTVVASAGVASPAEDLGAGRYAIAYVARGFDAPRDVALRVLVDGLALRPLTLPVTRGAWSASGGCSVHRAKTPLHTVFFFVVAMAAARRARSRTRGSSPADPGRTTRLRGRPARAPRG